MSISRVHTWSAGEVLSALDLNTEINNILNNSTDLVFPITKSISLGGFTLYFDATQIMGMTYSAKGINLSATTAINETLTTVASATTPDIWTGVGNVVSYTGTVTATGFAAAPQAGARRTLYCVGAAPFTAGANVLIDGYTSGNTYTATAGDKVEVIALTTTQFNLLPSNQNSPTFASITATTANITTGNITTGNITTGNITTLAGTTSINNGPLYGNRIINGPCEISQVNGTTAVTPAATAYVIDQFSALMTQASKLTFQQVSDAPAGLKNSLKITVAAQLSPAATDTFTIRQFIEGQNIIDFQLGTVGAVIITLSNWIKASNAGTYAAYLRNGATNRSYVGTIAVTSAWTQVKLTLTGDVTGTWATDTSIGMEWGIDLGSGSNFNTTADAWQAGSFTRTSGTGTLVAQVNGSTMNITGVDARMGSVAPLFFDRRGAKEELRKCQEYWCKSYDLDIAPATVTPNGGIGCGGTGAGQGSVWNVRYPVSMRSAPTITLYSPATGATGQVANLTTAADVAGAAITVGKNGFANVGIALVIGNAYLMHYTADSRL